MHSNAYIPRGPYPTISDMVGGDCSQPSGDFINRYRLLTSREYENEDVLFLNK